MEGETRRKVTLALSRRHSVGERIAITESRELILNCEIAWLPRLWFIAGLSAVSVRYQRRIHADFDAIDGN